MVGEAYRNGNGAESVPQQRIADKLDEYMSQRDYPGAERHLLYWLDEARALGDRRGELMVRNELVGHYRKTANKEQALNHANEALKLVDALGFESTLSAGTTYVNAATAFNAFGENERALQLFEKAAAIYECCETTKDAQLGGLYNNMAIACTSFGQYDKAEALYQRAQTCMERVEHGELERAITLLNMADTAVARENATHGEQPNDDGTPYEPACAFNMETVEPYLDAALELLDTPSIPRDGYYAFVCEKCAPTFAYYGYFLADADLRQRAETIYTQQRNPAQ